MLEMVTVAIRDHRNIRLIRSKVIGEKQEKQNVSCVDILNRFFIDFYLTNVSSTCYELGTVLGAEVIGLNVKVPDLMEFMYWWGKMQERFK